MILGVLILDLLAAAHGVDAALDQTLGRAGLAQQRAQLALVLQRGQHEQFGRDVGILALLGQLIGQIQQARQAIGDLHVAAGAFHSRQAVQRLAELGTQQIDVDIGLSEQRSHRAAVLVEQSRHHMRRFDELVIAAHRQTLGVAQG